VALIGTGMSGADLLDQGAAAGDRRTVLALQTDQTRITSS
jgi:hypothetical protein